MKIWKQTIAFQALCLGLFCFSENSAQAYDSYNPCCNPCSGEMPEVYIGAELIYWKPCVNNLDWALFSEDDLIASEEPQGRGRFLYIRPDWQAGLRLRIGKDEIYKGFGLSGSYTYLKADKFEQKEAIQSQTLIPTLVHGGLIPVDNFPTELADAKWNLRYQTFDVLLSHPFDCYGCHLLTPYFGVEGMILHQTLSSHFLTGIEEMRSRFESDFFGVGMKVGGFYAYKLNRCISFFGDVSASILHGEAEMKDRSVVNVDSGADRDLILRYEDCLFLPGYRIAVGFSYQFEICSWAMDCHLGYEFLRWHNIPNSRRYIQDGGALPLSTSPSTSTLGFQGIFVGAEIHF